MKFLFILELFQNYQLDPCGSHAPRHIQQKSAFGRKEQKIIKETSYSVINQKIPYNEETSSKNFDLDIILAVDFTLQLLLRQTMWLQPPFFSIVTWHLGHS